MIKGTLTVLARIGRCFIQVSLVPTIFCKVLKLLHYPRTPPQKREVWTDRKVLMAPAIPIFGKYQPQSATPMFMKFISTRHINIFELQTALQKIVKFYHFKLPLWYSSYNACLQMYCQTGSTEFKCQAQNVNSTWL